MIVAKSHGPDHLEVTDTPSEAASLFAWLGLVLGWLGVAMLAGGLVVAIAALVRGDSPLRGVGIAAQSVLLAAMGLIGGRAWRRLATRRITRIDRARATIETTEQRPGSAALVHREADVRVVAVRVEQCEARGPSHTPLRLVELWLVLAHERRHLLGDVDDRPAAVASLERVAAVLATGLGVPIERTHRSQHDASTITIVLPAVLPRVTRSLPLMSWGQKLMYVPGIAVLLGGGAALLMSLAPPQSVAWGFLAFAIPLVLVVPAIPMLALGGALRVQIEPGRLEIARVRAGVVGRPVVVPLERETIELHVHRFAGRSRGMARLTCASAGVAHVLVAQAQLAAVQHVADQLAALLSAPGASRM